jgi:hypothetical protein
MAARRWWYLQYLSYSTVQYSTVLYCTVLYLRTAQQMPCWAAWATGATYLFLTLVAKPGSATNVPQPHTWHARRSPAFSTPIAAVSNFQRALGLPSLALFGGDTHDPSENNTECPGSLISQSLPFLSLPLKTKSHSTTSLISSVRCWPRALSYLSSSSPISVSYIGCRSNSSTPKRKQNPIFLCSHAWPASQFLLPIHLIHTGAVLNPGDMLRPFWVQSRDYEAASLISLRVSARQPEFWP